MLVRVLVFAGLIAAAATQVPALLSKQAATSESSTAVGEVAFGAAAHCGAGCIWKRDVASRRGRSL